MTILLNIN